jgi:hypothetical protein
MKRLALIAFAGLAMSVGFSQTPTPTIEKEGTISGISKHRDKGGWIGVEIKEEHFRVTFYNEKKNPIPADVSSIILWWPVKYQPNPERTELVGGDSPSVLTSEQVVKRPYVFKLHVTLLTEADAAAAQSYGGAPAPSPEGYVLDFSG